jgi:hypothetical protein
MGKHGRGVPSVRRGTPRPAAAMSLRSDLREGHAIGVPVCCNLRWSLTYALDHHAEQAVGRGVAFTRDQIEYIPCGVFHKPTLTLAEYDRLLDR